jgi:diacylglycerol kinase (ATP)
MEKYVFLESATLRSKYTEFMLEPKRLVKSFHYALQGIHYAFRSQQNVRIHFLVGIIVIAAALFFRVNPFEMGILAIVILLVIAVEMVNTAIEKMVDLIIQEHHDDAKIAKDVASGMVLITAIGAVIVGILIFTPYVFHFFS